ncbi:MAG TPA: HU family DNA-binding protein [Cytophagaceae bacterium]
MTKADIVAAIAEKTGVDKNDVASTVESFFTVVKDSMAEGHNIYIRGFGTFLIQKKAKKVGRNISKNTTIIIDEHYAPKFKPAPDFKDKIKESKKINDKGLTNAA